ncbi:MAG TPA: CotH kinase family protein [Chitinophagales bacterium]|nr:CotH kinase family protein [Chitinophagales bacterium]
MTRIFTSLACICLCLLSTNLQAQTFSHVENTWVPDDGSSITFAIDVSGLPDVIDTVFGLETVCINMDHTWDSDLDIRLVAPDGTSFLLVSGIGGDGDNFNNTCFNESAATPVSFGSAPFSGSFIPMGDMGIANNGQNPNGVWQLLVYDTYAFADQGYMYDWSITFGDDPATSSTFDSSILPIVKINTGGQIIQNEPKVTAAFQIIDHGAGMLNHPTDTDYAFDGKILVELQGFTGPYYPKKNYDFDIVDDAGLEYDTVLLGLPSENDFILKAEYLDLSLMKNQIAYTMSRNMGRYAPRTKYCEVLVDGEYMGVFSLTEKIKRDDNRVDIAKLDSVDIAGEELTGGYIIEINENFTPNDWESDYLPINYATCGLPVAYKMVEPRIENIQPEQLDYIVAYVDSFEDALHGPDFLDTAVGYRNYISVKSFIDFMLVNEFSSNYDSYGRSTFLYKEKNGQLFIGPPWDYDRGYLPWTTEGWVWEITHPAWPFPFWWDKFRDDPEFRNEVYCRWTALRADVLSDEAFDTMIDSLAEVIGPDAQMRNFDKWPELGVTDPDYFVEEVRTFLHQRLAWMDEALEVDAVTGIDASFASEQVGLNLVQFTPSDLDADTYFWNFGDGTTSTEINPLHTYGGIGDYIVSLDVVKYYGCAAMTYSPVQVVVHVDNIENADITVMPNPATHVVNISGLQSAASIEILDITGKVVSTLFTDSKIDISAYPAGQYYLRITNKDVVRVLTFVKVDMQ